MSDVECDARARQFLGSRWGVVLAFVCSVAVWSIAGRDFWCFHGWAMDGFAESGSVNAYNDLAYAIRLLAVAIVALGSSLLIAAWWLWRPGPRGVVLLAGLCFLGLLVLWGDVAHAVVLFPDSDPVHMVVIVALITSAAVWPRHRAREATAA